MRIINTDPVKEDIAKLIENADTDTKRQLLLEMESIERGVERYHRELERRDFSDLPGGKTVLRIFMEPLVKILEEDFKSSMKYACRKAIMLLRRMPVHNVAYLTSRAILEMIAMGANDVRLFLVNRKISIDIRDDRRMFYQRQVFSEKFKEVSKYLKTNNRRKLVRLQKETGHKIDDPDVTWDYKMEMQVGAYLLNRFIEATGAVMITVQKKGKYFQKIMRVCEETRKMIEKYHYNNEALEPMNMPMVCKPVGWKGKYDGGYIFTRFPIIQFGRASADEEIKKVDTKCLEKAIPALNMVQRVPYQINPFVLDVLRQLWEEGGDISTMPQKNELPLPRRPSEADDDLDVRKAWVREAKEVHDQNAKIRSRAMQFHYKMAVAEKFRRENAIYFPHFMDFRGRMYPLPAFLNPQMDDVSRSLLRFGEGKTLGEEGFRNLCIFASNLYGNDKVSYDDRFEFIEGQLDDVVRAAREPFDSGFWRKADKPFQFLSCCVEIAEALEAGFENFQTRLPVHVDGTCNGIQWLAALGRDEVGGRFVNLVPGEEPEDIYAAVAGRFLNILHKETSKRAEAWKEYLGVTKKGPKDFTYEKIKGTKFRKFAKRATMTYGYGVTLHGIAAQLVGDGHLDHVDISAWEKQLQTRWVAPRLLQAIEETIPFAKLVKEFLIDTANPLTEADAAIEWDAPSGFRVFNRYNKLKSKTVVTVNGGIRVGLCIDEIAKKRQRDSVAPNFVHSLDSAHLVLFCNRWKKHYRQRFVCPVHDSFGFHAPDVKSAQMCIRETFVEINQVDLLAKYRDNIKALNKNMTLDFVFGNLPKRGKLSINDILNSEYFFG